MKALVTGATGFIGSHLVEELVKSGYSVTCLVRKTSNQRWIEGLDTTIFYGDCEDASSLSSLASDFDYIFHAAGLTKARREEDFFCANVKGTENLLKAVSARRGQLKRFVYLSSLAAIGPSSDGGPVTETAEPKPVSSYGRSKLLGEELVLKFRGKLPVSIIRPPAVYGPRDKDFFVLFKMLKKGFYPYYGKCYYSMVYVEDLVRGLITVAEAESAEGGVYFLSDGRVHSNSEIINEILEAMNTRAFKVRIPKQLMSLFVKLGELAGGGLSILNQDKLRELRHSHWICSSAKAEKEAGFITKVAIKEGIRWTADWYKIHQWL